MPESDKPKVDIRKLDPVGRWEGGPLRVYERPHESSKLEPAEEYQPYGLGYAIPRRATSTQPNGVRLRLELIDDVLRLVGMEVGELPDDPMVAMTRQIAAETDRRSGGRTTRAKKYERLPWISGGYLRSLAVDRISEQAAMTRVVRLYRRPRGEVVGVPAYEAHTLDAIYSDTDDDLIAAEQRLAAQTKRAVDQRRRPGRKPVPLETLQRAAEIAREAKGDGVSAIERLTLHMQISESTAKKYLRLARKEGLLPPSTRKGRR